ncbi:MAG: carboxypeptidase-like regulatory domain-containing protein [Terracidiphilus sp.]
MLARLGVWAALFATVLCVRAERHASTAGPDTAPATAQLGSIHGVVVSADGTVYEGVQVDLELTHADSPITASQQTDSGGAFNFANLPAGTFKIVISSAGFVTKAIGGALREGEAFDAHAIVLPIAAAASYVRVSAASQDEIAEEQVSLEEQQRVLGVIPNYFVSYDRNAAPLNARLKYQLAWRTSIDPVTWFMTGAVAGMEQASNAFSGYGQGAQGYGKRFGANTADTFINTMLTGAILPAVFRQDPRYFYKGTGSVASRAMYAIASSVICRGDNRHWQPDYSAILGGLASGGISNLYYPRSNRSGVEVTFANAAIGAGEGAVQNLIQEFVVRRLTPRLPHYGVAAH